MIFKGGTSIRKAFIQDYRFSDDLDFTLSSDITQEEMTTIINNVKSDVRDEIGTIFEDATPFKDVASGWKIILHYASRLNPNLRIRLILDVTKPEFEVVITPIEIHKINHAFSDGCDVDLTTYSLSEVTAEKLRALCQRGWPRDLYDVYNLWPRIEKSNFRELFLKKCEFKDVEPTISQYNLNKERVQRAWTKSLEHQLKALPKFDEVFQGTRKILEELLIPE